MTRFPRFDRMYPTDDPVSAYNRLVQDLAEYLRGSADATERRLGALEAVSASLLDHRTDADGVLWRWNGTTTEQFGATSLITAGAGSAALSVVTGANGAPALRLTTTALEGQAYFPVLDIALPPRYVLEYRVVYGAVAAANSAGWLLHTNGDASNLYGVEFTQASTAAASVNVVEGGATGSGGNVTLVTPSVDWPGTSIRVEFNGGPSTTYTTTPVLGSYVFASGPSGAAGGAPVDLAPGDWAGITVTRLALGAYAPSASTTTFDFQDLVVRRHPADR